MLDDGALVSLVQETVDRLSLDLRRLAVLTEAATGPFAVTAAIAAVAGADRVFAVARDSAYGSAAAAEHESLLVANACNAGQSLSVIRDMDAAAVGASDVITNLGFVRPLNAHVVSWMKPTAVVALMCEGWEFRPGDVDVDACGARGVVLLATNEHAPSFPIFAYCGALAVRMLLDAGFAVPGLRVGVLGRDPFTPVIVDALAGAGAVVRGDQHLTYASALETIEGVDAILVAEYASADVLLGDGGLVSAEEVARVAPKARVVQFAGAIDVASLERHGIGVWPLPPVGPRRMSRTLAHLGVRPVIELHAAGLKVGEIGARARLAGLSPLATIQEACRRSDLVQAFSPRP